MLSLNSGIGSGGGGCGLAGTATAGGGTGGTNPGGVNNLVADGFVWNPDGNFHTIGFSWVPGRYGLLRPAAPTASGACDSVWAKSRSHRQFGCAGGPSPTPWNDWSMRIGLPNPRSEHMLQTSVAPVTHFFPAVLGSASPSLTACRIAESCP